MSHHNLLPSSFNWIKFCIFVGIAGIGLDWTLLEEQLLAEWEHPIGRYDSRLFPTPCPRQFGKSGPNPPRREQVNHLPVGDSLGFSGILWGYLGFLRIFEKSSRILLGFFEILEGFELFLRIWQHLFWECQWFLQRNTAVALCYLLFAVVKWLEAQIIERIWLACEIQSGCLF